MLRMFAKFMAEIRTKMIHKTKAKMIGPELNNNQNENDLQNVN